MVAWSYTGSHLATNLAYTHVLAAIFSVLAKVFPGGRATLLSHKPSYSNDHPPLLNAPHSLTYIVRIIAFMKKVEPEVEGVIS